MRIGTPLVTVSRLLNEARIVSTSQSPHAQRLWDGPPHLTSPLKRNSPGPTPTHTTTLHSGNVRGYFVSNGDEYCRKTTNLQAMAIAVLLK